MLTHDVEGPEGLERVRSLMQLEMEMGFRSSFNFVPKGTYSVPQELIRELVGNGFEVGVHDYHHDGYLYSSPSEFAQKAKGINQTLRDWNAVGFRSGFMLCRMPWLHALDIEYDASTFDTDPFEPQPEGRHTIFPFWVEPELSTNGKHGANGTRKGYVELPYTLPQDSTLFLLLNESGPGLWQRKLKWIVEHGGMALVDTHPDYMDFDGGRSAVSYPAEWYRSFLGHVREVYGNHCWHVLPREVAGFARNSMTATEATGVHPQRSERPSVSKIWVDLDNTPHIPFFKPILRELQERGYEIVLTARDAYQVCEMASAYGLNPKIVGRHYGKHRALKFLGFLYRAAQLLPFARGKRPVLSLNHGSRSQVLASNLLGIPSITIMDYEHSRSVPLAHPTWMVVPKHYPDHIPGQPSSRVLRYSGIKEDVYAPEFVPDPRIIDDLGIDRSDVVVTVRPPASEAHYHNPEADVLFETFMERVCSSSGIFSILLPRNKRQEQEIRSRHANWFEKGKLIIPSGVVNGLNLLWHSDLVVSGGGTMNREAAALGVPVYSIFRGKTGAVDLRLQAEGRMLLIENVQQVHDKIQLKKRPRELRAEAASRPALEEIVGHVEEIIKLHAAPGTRMK